MTTTTISRKSRNLAYTWMHVTDHPYTGTSHGDPFPETTDKRMSYSQMIDEREREQRETAWTTGALYVDGKRVLTPVRDVLEDLSLLVPGETCAVEVAS
jgi:hypothetical protein